jgi:pyrroloquinoline quinone biosynthesis protein B
MIAKGVGQKSSRRMGHVPMAGPQGSLELLSRVKAGHKVYVHINNTNPVLERTSPERNAVEQAGWEIGEDGMEFVL